MWGSGIIAIRAYPYLCATRHVAPSSVGAALRRLDHRSHQQTDRQGCSQGCVREFAIRFSVSMAGPEGEGAGKGKGKSRGLGGGSTAGPDRGGENTPPLDQEGSRTLAAASAGTPRSRSKLASAVQLCLGDMEEMEAPRRKTVCLFAMFVSALALLRSFLLPVS